MNNVCYYKTPIGVILRIVDDGKHIKEVDFPENPCLCCINSKASKLGDETKKQLKEYFLGERKTFQLPIEPQGTEFQKSVWKELMNIPYGSVKSYKEIAEAIGNPRSYRAVGNANNKNPISIIIPCHRVIKGDKTMGGYGGGIDIKEKLLEIEGSIYGINQKK